MPAWLRFSFPAPPERWPGDFREAFRVALMAELGIGGRVAFDTQSGELTVTKGGGLYEMDFPNWAPRRAEVLPEHAEVFGAAPIEAWVSNFFILVFADEAARGKAWDAFRQDPEWLKLRALPAYADAEIVSGITASLLRPAEGSQI